MTLGERITDFYYWDDIQPYVETCIKRASDGFRPMPLTEEKKFYNAPEFRITMTMPKLSIRIILQMMHECRNYGQYLSYVFTPIKSTKTAYDLTFEYVMQALYILDGLRVWCCHLGEDIPMMGTDKPERINRWMEWGKQRGYINGESLV